MHLCAFFSPSSLVNDRPFGGVFVFHSCMIDKLESSLCSSDAPSIPRDYAVLPVVSTWKRECGESATLGSMLHGGYPWLLVLVSLFDRALICNPCIFLLFFLFCSSKYLLLQDVILIGQGWLIKR